MLDIHKAARICGRTPKAMRNLVARQRIPYRKVAGRVQFIRAELEEWLAGSPGVTLEELREREGA